jgi:hypothetical protein
MQPLNLPVNLPLYTPGTPPEKGFSKRLTDCNTVKVLSNFWKLLCVGVLPGDLVLCFQVSARTRVNLIQLSL